MARELAVAALMVLAMPLASRAQDVRLDERKDYQILKDSARAVEQYARFTVFDDVNLATRDGVVTLTGKVTMPFKRDDIGRRVAKVKGVKQVDNRLDVLPVSTFDDQLRYQIARAIYGNPNFWQYASMANPPIHIVVDRGRVTLTGVVQSDVDRMLAHSLATGLGAFSVTNLLKTDAEVRAGAERIN